MGADYYYFNTIIGYGKLIHPNENDNCDNNIVKTVKTKYINIPDKRIIMRNGDVIYHGINNKEENEENDNFLQINFTSILDENTIEVEGPYNIDYYPYRIVVKTNGLIIFKSTLF
mgnify:CR=1 FL=1